VEPGYDAVVVGAGIVGVSTAWELVRRGSRVLLLDRGEVSGGTTGLGEGNVLCSDKDAGPELELTKLGLAMYDELDALLGDVAKIRRKGALIVHPEEATWRAEPARVERLVGAGVDARLVSGDELRTLEPELTGPLLGATLVPGDLQCDPRAITRALASHASAAGLDIRTGVAVSEIVVEGGRAIGVRVASAAGTVPAPGAAAAPGELVRARAVVLAAGPWSAPLASSAGLSLPVEPRKGQLARLRLPVPDERFLRHKVVDGSYLLSVASGGAGRQVSTVIETTSDGAVVVGSSRERVGFDATVDRALAEDMRARASRLIPAAASLEIEHVWVGFRPWLPDHLPAIGESARIGGLWVGTGHEGAGVALGPITGRILAGAIHAEPPPLDLTPFSPDRFG